MTIKEFYEKIGGDYDEVLGRLFSEALIKKFLIKFLTDKSYQTFFEEIEKQNIEEAFRAAHTLKGVCQNLGLGTLFKSSSDIAEALRGGQNNVTQPMHERLKADYEYTVECLKAID